MRRFIALLLFALTIPGFCQQYFSGVIDRDTRWSGEMYINGDVVVNRGVILSIESGSRIHFLPNRDVRHSGMDKNRAELIVHGVILARGSSASSPILFTSAADTPQMNDWYGIVIKNMYEKSVLENCIVEYGYKGITCYGSAPQISDSEIRFNYNTGISCEVRASPLIQNCLIMGNGFAGINSELASTPIIAQSVITQNNYGVIIFSRSQPDLGHVPAAEGQSNGENKLFNNFDFDVYNHSIENIYAQNNFWNTNKPDEIRFTIYDHLDNPAYGQVFFQPIFLKRKKRRFSVPAIALHPSAEEKKRTMTVTETPSGQSSVDTTRQVHLDSLAIPPSAAALPADTTVKVLPETVFVYKSPPPAPVKKAEVPKIKEPVLEAFLDSGKRQYIRRAKPRYPNIYLRTGTEGDVLIDVVVNRQGMVESTHVLKSDGELFTEAALAALKKFRYRPGKFRGHPVKFKVIERFRFKRSENQ